MNTIHILYADGISAAGNTPQDAVKTFYDAAQPFRIPSHFNYKDLKLGVIDDLAPEPGQSRAFALIQRLCSRLPALPPDTRLYLATTVGAIDILEQSAADEKPDCTGLLFQEAKRLTHCKDAILVAAACASGQTATAMAMRALSLNHCKYALVIGIDITSEFVTGGFASLRAYSKTIAHPYDVNRDGLLLGEGAGALLLSQDDTDQSLGELISAFESCDASHITAPDLTGETLAALINRTLDDAKITPNDIGGIIGHGTGTVFNDASEIAALNRVFATPCPLISIKGNTGHTLGATGVLQIVYALQFLKHGQLPPQAGLTTPAEGAEGFVSTKPQPFQSNLVLSLNVGFGGLNSTILLQSK